MDVNINQDIHVLQTEIERPSIVSKIKYDPAEKALKSIIEGITFVRGDIYIYDFADFDHVLDESATSSAQLDVGVANKIASEFETSITKYRKIWGSIPTLDDYFELDALHNVEEVESAFYKASEAYGW